MRLANEWKDYEILDMASGEKLERWGNIYLVRPDPQIIWKEKQFPNKWKNMNSRANILDDMDEDTSIHVTVTRATKGNTPSTSNTAESDDENWQDEVNSSIEIRKSTEEEIKEAEKERAKTKAQNELNKATKVEAETEDDLDYWPEEWEDEEEWED